MEINMTNVLFFHLKHFTHIFMKKWLKWFSHNFLNGIKNQIYSLYFPKIIVTINVIVNEPQGFLII